MDTEGALRHLAFFEELGKMEEADTSWPAVSAGLVVLRLVDSWMTDGSVVQVDDWGVKAVREAIAEVPETTPLHRILGSVVETMLSTTRVNAHAVCPRLMAYGQALEFESRYALAADVYATIIAHSHPLEDADLVVAAHIQLGFCLKNTGDLAAADQAYVDAGRVAMLSGDMIGVLRARIGESRIAAALGNMPEAEAILDETIARADEHGFQDIRARALHDRAAVAGLRGQYDRAVQYAYKALELTSSQRERDRILSDIAAGFLDLGLVDAARDACLVLVATAQDQYVRWAAGLNLIEVAMRQSMEPMFDMYRRDFDNVELPPYLQARYFLVVGNGYRSFGRPEEAISYLRKAIDVASSHQLNQILFEAEESLASARVVARRRPAPSVEPSPEVLGVARAVRAMKVAAAGVD